MKKTTILKVLVGSRAHGLADEKSDNDSRSVYVEPTEEILSLTYRQKGTNTIDKGGDNTSYEIGHFLHLATKCNPSILEVFLAPVIEANEDGKALRELFPYVWHPKGAYDAFTGYAHQQRKKFFDKEKDVRLTKFAVAYPRVLWQLCQLLSEGKFDVEIKEKDIRERLMKFKAGKFTYGEVIDYAQQFHAIANELIKTAIHQANLAKVNDFLLYIREIYWG